MRNLIINCKEFQCDLKMTLASTSPYLMLRLNGLLQPFAFGLQIFDLLSCLQKFFSHFCQLLVGNLVVIIEILYWNRQHFLRLEQISNCQLGDSENFQQFRRHFGNNLDEFLHRITESQTYTMGWYPIWSWRIFFCKDIYYIYNSYNCGS